MKPSFLITLMMVGMFLFDQGAIAKFLQSISLLLSQIFIDLFSSENYSDIMNHILIYHVHFLFIENKFSSIGPIYYEYGSMVITFDSSNVAVIAYEILKNRLFDDKKLLGNRSVIKAQCTSS